MWGSIKIRKSDRLFRQLLLKKRGERCERCMRIGPVQVSHFYTRQKETTRFSEINCQLLCAGCHQYFTANPAEYVVWMKKRLGEKEYNKLMVEAHRVGKRDDKLMELVLTQELNVISSNKN